MNVFFTCKNTLVILLQLYRLYVVYSEHYKTQTKTNDFELTNISIISKADMYDRKKNKRNVKKDKISKHKQLKTLSEESDDSSSSSSENDSSSEPETKKRYNFP